MVCRSSEFELGSGDSSVVGTPDSWSKGPRFESHAGAAGEFSSSVSAFGANSYFGVRSTPVLPQ